jgi:hypothetical protein
MDLSNKVEWGSNNPPILTKRSHTLYPKNPKKSNGVHHNSRGHTEGWESITPLEGPQKICVFQVCGQNLALETILPKKKPMSSNFTKKIHFLPKKTHILPHPPKNFYKKNPNDPKNPPNLSKKNPNLTGLFGKKWGWSFLVKSGKNWGVL